jgi:hypothetical protein
MLTEHGISQLRDIPPLQIIYIINSIFKLEEIKNMHINQENQAVIMNSTCEKLVFVIEK